MKEVAPVCGGRQDCFLFSHSFIPVLLKCPQPGEEDSELSPQGDGAPWKELERKSDMVRSESDQDHSDCYVPGGIDWRGQVLFWMRKEQGGLDHSWG